MKRPEIAALVVSVSVIVFTGAACNREPARKQIPAAQASPSPSPSPRATTTPSLALSHPKVRYSIRQSGETDFGPSRLLASLNGKTTEVIGKDKKKCLQIVEQRDFDGDGLLDALVEDITACGGNCCPNQFFFVSLLPDGEFAISDEFADSWQDPVVSRWKGRWSVVVVSNNAGVNLERPVEFTRRFVLEAGKAVKVEEHQRQDMKAIVEMRSEIFRNDKPDAIHTLHYDLDGDGRKDTIEGQLWERWGSIVWTVKFANGKEFSSKTACKRIGVLATKTNGVHNLVCDQDSVLQWDGTEYKE
jgi:hypothetical protein